MHWTDWLIVGSVWGSALANVFFAKRIHAQIRAEVDRKAALDADFLMQLANFSIRLGVPRPKDHDRPS